MIRAALNFPPSGRAGSRAVVVGGVSYFLLFLVSLIGTIVQGDEFGQPPASITIDSLLDGSSVVFTLGVFGAFLLVYLLTRGYFVAVLAAVIAGESTPPAFARRTIVDGCLATLITVAYLSPGFVVGRIAVELRHTDPATIGATTVNAAGALLVLGGLFWTMFALYVLPAALALFATDRSVGRAFDWRTLLACVLTEDYAVGRLVGGCVRSVLFVIAVLLQFFLVGFFLRFYTHVSGYHLYASAVANALDDHPSQ